MFQAVLSNNPEVVSYLLDNGADKNLKDVMDFSALDYALKLGNKNIQALLEE
jgi:ankyrin repeat protein